MFENILILLKSGLQAEVELIEKIREFSKSKVKIVGFNELTKSGLEGADLIITLGGDGIFVKAANLIEDSFILGINSDPDSSEGALASLNISEVDKLKEVFEGKFDVHFKHRACVKINGSVLGEHALNEVYVGTSFQFHSSRYKIKFNGVEEEHRSSGVIVSTGTGSPAWFSSAGGKVFSHDEERLEFIVREPYIGKRVYIPKILKGSIFKGDSLIIEAKRSDGGVLAINETLYAFNEGDSAEIFLSDKPLKVLVPK